MKTTPVTRSWLNQPVRGLATAVRYATAARTLLETDTPSAGPPR